MRNQRIIKFFLISALVAVPAALSGCSVSKYCTGTTCAEDAMGPLATATATVAITIEPWIFPNSYPSPSPSVEPTPSPTVVPSPSPTPSPSHTVTPCPSPSLSPKPSCVRSRPTVKLLEYSQTICSGEQAVYSVLVTNNNSSECGASNFVLNHSLIGGGVDVELAQPSLTVAPGQTGSVSLDITVPAAVEPNNFSFSVSAFDSSDIKSAGVISGLLIVQPCTNGNYNQHGTFLQAKNKRILGDATTRVAQEQVKADSEPAAKMVPGDGQCSDGYHLATLEETSANQAQICSLFATAQINGARLANGASIAISSNRCSISSSDNNHLPYSVCVKTVN